MKKQIAKAIKDAITTALGVVDGQLVSVRDRLNEVKTGEAEGVDEKGRLGVLQDVRLPPSPHHLPFISLHPC